MPNPLPLGSLPRLRRKGYGGGAFVAKTISISETSPFDFPINVTSLAPLTQCTPRGASTCQAVGMVQCMPTGVSQCVANRDGNVGTGNVGKNNYGNYNIGDGNFGGPGWWV